MGADDRRAAGAGAGLAVPMGRRAGPGDGTSPGAPAPEGTRGNQLFIIIHRNVRQRVIRTLVSVSTISGMKRHSLNSDFYEHLPRSETTVS